MTNTAQGTITATGLMPAPLATISAIYVTGPSGGGIGAIGVTDQGVVTAATATASASAPAEPCSIPAR